jgi:hypothetical protein
VVDVKMNAAMTMKIRLVTIGVTVLAVAVGLYFYPEARRPRRVWVTYSETYQWEPSGRYESKDTDDKLFAEERLGWKIRVNQKIRFVI